MECHHLLKFRISLKISAHKPYNSPFHISLLNASIGYFYAAGLGQIMPLWWRTDIVRAFIPPDVPWQAQPWTHLIRSHMLATFSAGWFYVAASQIQRKGLHCTLTSMSVSKQHALVSCLIKGCNKIGVLGDFLSQRKRLMAILLRHNEVYQSWVIVQVREYKWAIRATFSIEIQKQRD